MSDFSGHTTPSGVFVADDFRDNLVIDRYDSVFVGMRASKLKHMRSRNSEDVVTWNVFRTLRQIDPNLWVEPLMTEAFGSSPVSNLKSTTVELWRGVPPPPALLQSGDEGISEIDIVIENPHWVMFIEAKLTSDISIGTTTRPNRDQVLRNLDVGSFYAGVRDFYFAMLVRDQSRSPQGAARVAAYEDRHALRERLPHRHDGLQNLRATGMLTWANLHTIVAGVPAITKSPLEAECASRCAAWLEARHLGQSASAV